MVDVSELRDLLIERANTAADQALARLGDDLQQACPVNRGESDDGRAPGTLRDSMEVTPGDSGEVWTAELAFTDEAATYTDEGTEPHVIRPVNAKMLRWIAAGGTIVFAREVNHPGTQGTRWWSDRVTPEAWAELVSDALDASSA